VGWGEMNIYHTIRVFLEELFKLPFAAFFTLLFVIALVFEMFFENIEDVCRKLCPKMTLSHFNVFKTYKIVKSNENSTEFHKWTGKRIKK